ncbi:MAG: transketolase, partial [Rikenellaceae bacterium]|nr:transketolase [Rikenellaceae bacterium]
MISNIKELKIKTEEARKRVVEIIFRAQGGHIGGSMSSLNMVSALYFHTLNVDPQHPKMPDRDRFILSKGHSVEGLYCVLSKAGFFPDSVLDTYGKAGSVLAGHPTVEVPGIEVNSGALGHGLSVGIGMAMAARMDGKPYRTYVLMGDGEQGEGSICEAAMAAGHYKLDNLVAIIDRNGMQISDTTENVMSLEPMRQRWESFGWDVVEINGDSMEEIVATLDALKVSTVRKPHLIVSRTTKGRG